MGRHWLNGADLVCAFDIELMPVKEDEDGARRHITAELKYRELPFLCAQEPVEREKAV